MVEYDVNFTKEQLPAEDQEILDNILYNSTRIVSHQGELVFTKTGVYWFFTQQMERTVYKPWSITFDEIDSWNKKGLAGFQITLKDGKNLLFSNVFRKSRNFITEMLEKSVH